ncbi:hypothetical protein Taro_056107 [Colocasia esculenta]|uniref:Mitotic checkpoint protein BUB3.3 n=1 Tax=Colocasia esculenta TaxID=4460 RepID=A0A843XUT9_COLES|nr:hypothetical protein [Colocasia esculenta]
MAGSAVELEIKDAISRIRFAPRTSHLLISSWDSVLRLYDVDAAEIRLEVSSGAPLLDCCFLDESVALSAGVDCCIRRYDLPSGKQDTVGIHGDVATSIEYSEETGQLVSTGLDKKLIFWDIHAMNRKSGCLEMDSEVTSMSLCGHYIIVAIGTHANVYDLRNLKGPLQTQGSSMDYSICCVRSLSRKQGFAAGSVDGRVALKSLEALASSEMGYDTFVTGDNEGYAVVWDAQSKKRIFEFPRHADSIASLSYDHSGQKLAIACSHTYQDVKEM